MMLMTPDAWIRGANAWCGWLRLFLLPLALLPLWFGQPLAAMMVLMAWMMIPRLFRKPITDANWMTRAQLGVRIWRSRPLNDPRPLMMMCLVMLSLMRAVDTVMGQRPVASMLYIAAYFATYLVFLSRTAVVYERSRDGDEPEGPSDGADNSDGGGGEVDGDK